MDHPPTLTFSDLYISPSWPLTFLASSGTLSEELHWNFKFRCSVSDDQMNSVSSTCLSAFSQEHLVSWLLSFLYYLPYLSKWNFMLCYFKGLLPNFSTLFSCCLSVWVFGKTQPWPNLILHLFWKNTHTAQCLWRNFIQTCRLRYA